MRYLRKVAAVFWKDVIAELRTKDIFSAMFVFALLSVIIFQFAFDLRVDNARQVVPGVLWVAISFSGVLGLNRSFVLEKDKGSLEGLLLTPVDRSAIYFGKMLANLVFMLVVEAFLVPLLTPAVLLIVLLGTIGFAAVGTIFAALSVNTRAREVLLPILLLPVMVPVLIAGVRATGGLLDGDALADLSNWVQLLVVFDIMYIAASFMTFDFVVEE